MSSRPLVRNRSLVVSLSLLLVASLATAVRAQPLADRVPADTLIYVGWLGYDAKSPGFAGSHLEAVMQAAEFKKLVDETLPGLLAKVAKKDANADQVITLAKPIVMPMLKHPTAILSPSRCWPRTSSRCPREASSARPALTPRR